ncbi:MAG: hypothetical protein ACFFDH_00425 [Promethearchaeota archaeon]
MLGTPTGQSAAKYLLCGSKEAMRQTGYSQGHISEVCRGEKKTYKSFIWKYSI